jgi:hypothetical protein
VVVGPHSLPMRSVIDVVACRFRGFELEVDREGGRRPEAVEDLPGLEAWRSRGEDLGVAPDGDDAVGVRVVVGAWEEVGDWESWVLSVLGVRC